MRRSLGELSPHEPYHSLELAERDCDIDHATGTLHTALGGKITQEVVKLGVEMARTAAKANFRSLLPN